MATSPLYVQVNPEQWVIMDRPVRDPQVLERCTPEVVAAAISHIDGAEVVSVTVNTTGRFQPPPPMMPGFPPLPEITGLPDYCDVRIRQTGPGGHVAEVVVWLPLDWNGRFLGCTGGGNRTEPAWAFPLPAAFRGNTMPIAIRNGFATAGTDAGNRDPRPVDWGLDPETRELDWDLIENWVHRSTHEMTIIGKAVTEAVHGVPPQYSYLQGTSGGGREAMMQAQRYSQNYDGIWAADPALNWSRFILAEIWPVLVMNEENNPLAQAKLEAFREAVLDAVSGSDGDRFLPDVSVPDWDPHSIVGTHTDAGVITETDARVMRKIWDGPRRASGEQLWYGLRPGTQCWGAPVGAGFGLAGSATVDGKVQPVPFFICNGYVGGWLQREPNWDWTTLTYEEFERLFDHSVAEFAALDADNPDLSGVRDAGAKVLLSHGLADEVIFPEGTLHYYQRVLETMGGPDNTDPFFRLFLSPGDGHGHLAGDGPGLSMASGMAALMNWVEHGVAPDSIVGERYDATGTQLLEARPLFPYPAQSRYTGQGDRTDPANYTRVVPEAADSLR
ncbi:tannase/feruloyl esterase family alpha/beta hydrolase [Nocardia sp. NPDC005745]|uniref:tannase/feruloyl esterase family alpha/beta hydrolase n=1 Tax=Nocardia sp. NPDC005745 TaxID=3157061 RepID=UPI0033EC13F5